MGDDSGGKSLTRRACLRLAILGAAGLSFLPGCRPRAGEGKAASTRATPDAAHGGVVEQKAADTPQDSSPLGKWARLGRVWRELSAHERKQRGAGPEAKADFGRLKTEMAAALAALPASPELRAAFEERWEHINRTRYAVASCYGPPGPGDPQLPREAVEKQVRELEQLMAEGKLSAEAGRKAAHVLAVQAAYLTQLRATEKTPMSEGKFQGLRQLQDQYLAKKIEPGAAAQAAGERLTEFTVDKPGWLTDAAAGGGTTAKPGKSGKDGPPRPTCYAPPPPASAQGKKKP